MMNEINQIHLYLIVSNLKHKQNELWQHFCGVEIETDKDLF